MDRKQLKLKLYEKKKKIGYSIQYYNISSSIMILFLNHKIQHPSLQMYRIIGCIPF